MGSFTNGVYVPSIGEVGWGPAGLTDTLTRLGEKEINVKAAPYGAVGNNSHDDTANIQAALDAAMAAPAGTAPVVYFPAGVYKTSGALTVGDGAQLLNITIAGAGRYSSSQGPVAGAFIYSSASNANILTVRAPAGLSQQSVHISGLELVYSGSVGTGVGLDLTGGELGGQISGCLVDNVNVARAGVGFKLGASVNPRFSNCSVSQSTRGFQFKNVGSGTDGPNLAQFENCYVQGCSTYGVAVEGTLSHSRWTSCVFQSNTGPAFYVGSGAANVMFGAHFDSCWWEFPGSDMIRIDGGWLGGTFTSCRFDGSTGAGGRHVFNLNAAAASNASVTGLVFLEPYIANLNGGKFMNLANADPSASTDPYYGDITIIGAHGHGSIEGLGPPSLRPSMMNVIHGDFVDSDILTNATTGERPAYQRLSVAANVGIRGDLGAVQFAEVTAPAAGPADSARLYIEDNGAGKTRLMVKFATGAAQQIAIQP